MKALFMFIIFKGTAIARGIVFAQLALPENVVLTKRKLDTLTPFKNEGFSVTTDVTQAVKVHKDNDSVDLM